MRFRAPAGHVGAAGPGPDVDAQLRVAGPETPPPREAIIGGQLRSVGLAVLPVGDDERVGCGRVELLHAAEPVVPAVERRHRKGKGALLGAGSQLVSQLFFLKEARASGPETRLWNVNK